MKYPNCQFENRNLAELFSGCDKQLRQEIVHRHCSTSPLRGMKFCDRYPMPQIEQVPALPKSETTRSLIVEPVSFDNSRHRIYVFPGEVSKEASFSSIISSSIGISPFLSRVLMTVANYISVNLNLSRLSHNG